MTVRVNEAIFHRSKLNDNNLEQKQDYKTATVVSFTKQPTVRRTFKEQVVPGESLTIGQGSDELLPVCFKDYLQTVGGKDGAGTGR